MKEDPSYVAVSYKWIEKGLMDDRDVGYLVLDNEWNFTVPLVHANRYNVQYYGLKLDPLEDDEVDDILCKNGGMYDFDYSNAYDDYLTQRDGQKGTGGCRIERHQFTHVETPLSAEPNSGCFVVGKEDKQTNKLHLTAFIIAMGQTLIVPPYTIHTNDYQRGLWRTYLEVGDIDICDMVKKGQVLNAEKLPATILLKFECAVNKKRMREYEMLNIIEEENDEKQKESMNEKTLQSIIDKMDETLNRMNSLDYIHKTVFGNAQSTEKWQLEQSIKRIQQNNKDMMSQSRKSLIQSQKSGRRLMRSIQEYQTTDDDGYDEDDESIPSSLTVNSPSFKMLNQKKTTIL